MDLLVQQKIQAAIRPLANKIENLEEQIKVMLPQIQTLQILQNKLAAQTFCCTQSQTQQTRLEPKVAEKSKLGKQTVAEKTVHPKKETNTPKPTSKTQAHPVNHNVKKQTKKQTKNKVQSPKDSHEVTEKPKLLTEQEKVAEVAQQHKQQTKQEQKIEQFQAVTTQQTETARQPQLGQPEQDLPNDKEKGLQRSQLEKINTEPQQAQVVQKVESVEVQETQQSYLNQSNIKSSEEIKIQAIQPSVENQNPVQSQHLNNSDLTKIQNQNLDIHLEKVQKVQLEDTNPHANEAFAKTKQPKIQVSNPVKKQTKKPGEQNRDKTNKPSNTQKQKMQSKPATLNVKESRLKQKSGGKHGDPEAKKSKGMQSSKIEKKEADL